MKLRIYFDFDIDTYRERTEEALAITGGRELDSGTNLIERDCDIELPNGADEKKIRRELSRSGFRFERGACGLGA